GVLFSLIVSAFLFFFFFSSRRRHTRSDRDWSSDVCSSDLDTIAFLRPRVEEVMFDAEHFFDGIRRNRDYALATLRAAEAAGAHRSEERRVGKECRSRWSPNH